MILPGSGLADLHLILAQAVMGDDSGLKARTRQMEQMAREGRYPSGSYLPALASGFAAFEHGDFAGAIAALAPLAGPIDCLSPALGQSFLAKGRVVKSGRKQIFTNAELYASDNGKSKLVATGTAILVPLGEPSSDISHAFHTEAH